MSEVRLQVEREQLSNTNCVASTSEFKTWSFRARFISIGYTGWARHFKAIASVVTKDSARPGHSREIHLHSSRNLSCHRNISPAYALTSHDPARMGNSNHRFSRYTRIDTAYAVVSI